eukprot:jgi/Ulvmu1/8783/UM048_0038.1
MASKVQDDHFLPYEAMRVRVQGSVLIAQPYYTKYCSGNCLMVDLLRGTVKVPDKVMDLKTDYMGVHAILGVQHLRTCSVVAVVTAAEEVAVFNGAPVYKATTTAVLCANGSPPTDAGDARLYKFFSQATDPLSGAAGLYFSHRANVTTTLQQYLAMDHNQPLWKRSVDELWWNAAISSPLHEAEAHRFVVPCILGFCKQIKDAPLSAGVKQDSVSITLIARRGVRRSGTRHWRRGADAGGSVANFVETEQVIETTSGEVSATVQIRGSIPLAWSQVPNTKYKPSTDIPNVNKYSRVPFYTHARSMTARYGAITAVNLVNSHGTEGKLSAAYAAAVNALPSEIPFTITTFDFHKECGATNYQNLSKLWAAIAPAIAAAGSLRTGGELGRVRGQQKGVVRTNCIDCLDRTNVVQALLGRRALEALLSDLLLMDSGSPLATSFPKLEQQFRILWADHGDALSWQYAGTGALKSGFTRTGKRTALGLLDDGVKSAVRYYLNNFEDGHKQDAVDLISGAYRPRRDTPPPPPPANGAMWVLLAVAFLVLALSSAAVAPYSRRITFLYTVLPLLVLAAACAGIVNLFGTRVTCRPLLRPDLVQPWLPAQPRIGGFAQHPTVPSTPQATPIKGQAKKLT